MDHAPGAPNSTLTLRPQPWACHRGNGISRMMRSGDSGHTRPGTQQVLGARARSWSSAPPPLLKHSRVKPGKLPAERLSSLLQQAVPSLSGSLEGRPVPSRFLWFPVTYCTLACTTALSSGIAQLLTESQAALGHTPRKGFRVPTKPENSFRMSLPEVCVLS